MGFNETRAALDAFITKRAREKFEVLEYELTPDYTLFNIVSSYASAKVVVSWIAENIIVNLEYFEYIDLSYSELELSNTEWEIHLEVLEKTLCMQKYKEAEAKKAEEINRKTKEYLKLKEELGL